MNVRRIFFNLLDIIILISIISILFIFVTGGYRLEFLGIGFVSFERPFVFLIVSILLKKLFYRKMTWKDGLIGRIVFFIKEVPDAKIRIFIFLISLLFFTLIPFRVVSIWAPTGDEPHFLMIASSLAKDGDVNLLNNYENKDYNEFYPGHLIAHSKINVEGKIYSAHGIGLPVIILPGYIFGNRYGASYTIGVLFALLAVVIFSLCYQVTKDKIISAGLAFLMSFTVPLVFFSYQIFTELPAALIAAYIFYFGLNIQRNSVSYLKMIFAGVLLAYLPWLHVRYMIFTIILLIYLLYKGGIKKGGPLIGMVIASTLLLLSYMKVLYGIFSFTAQYCGIQAGLSYIIKGMLGNLLDCRFGLFLYSPYYIFLGAGLYFFFKEDKKGFLWWLLIVAPFFISVSSYYHWHGGWCPPLRYITPIIPLFIVPLGYLFKSCRNRSFYLLFFIFAFFSLSITRILAYYPDLMYNLEYNNSKILDYLNKDGINIKWLFPSLFEMATRDYVIVVGWIVIFLILNYSVIKKGKDCSTVSLSKKYLYVKTQEDKK